MEITKLKDVEIIRALQWLENKNLLKIKKESKELIELDVNGKNYVKNGLPEKRFLEVLKEELSLDEIKEKAKLNKDEIMVSLGHLKKKSAIILGKKLKITDQGKKYLEQESLEEKFLKKLPLEVDKLNDEEKNAFNELKKRKEIIKIDLVKDVFVNLTDLGKKFQNIKIKDNFIEQVNQKLLKTGSWKNKRFRRYDISSFAPKYYQGKRHFVNQALDYVKRIWLDMGFKEMKGNLVGTSFWNFDALFTSQEHSVRDLHDTFFISNPEKGKLPSKELVNNIKKTHEDGWTTGSKGWQYKWNEEEAKKNVLRTHTTILSAQTLVNLKKEDLPAKFFSVGRCFRNESLDWSHLFEFNQTEGIVIDEDANLRNLIGYLKEFFAKMGFPKARFRPAYFPYTEPSMEIDVYHPIHKKWVELGGAGMFRPEVVKPLLGKDIPVLAWGPGIDRIITDAYKILDIRELYKNDIKQLREIKQWMK
ncbi:phenylalanine--tRNA ligase subunit alpha [archaeon]|nr:phenylalanine--tRNA ligase subunit alpha [archaeon]